MLCSVYAIGLDSIGLDPTRLDDWMDPSERTDRYSTASPCTRNNACRDSAPCHNNDDDPSESEDPMEEVGEVVTVDTVSSSSSSSSSPSLLTLVRFGSFQGSSDNHRTNQEWCLPAGRCPKKSSLSRYLVGGGSNGDDERACERWSLSASTAAAVVVASVQSVTVMR